MDKMREVILQKALEIDVSSPGMLYQKLANNIKAAIDKGILEEGDFFPPQRELAANLSVSRVTVTKAIDELRRQGVVKLIPRQGVQVIASKISAIVPPRLQLSDQYNFTRDMQARGMTPYTHWLKKDNAIATTHEALTLGLPQNSKVGHYWRLRYADDLPIGIEVACVPATVIPDCKEVGESLYEALKSRGILPVRATQTVTACSADKYTAEQLKITINTPVLYIERRGYDKINHCVEYTRYWYLADKYCFIAEITLD
jgi:GntR family transcriptional regulator